MRGPAGFKELEHTADWELKVWAPDLPSLLEQSARGMYMLAGVKLKPGDVHQRSISLHGQDAESLLVQFLTELLWFEQKEDLGFDQFSIKVDEQLILKAKLQGACILSLDKEIKAVTYHNLQVEHTPNGLQVCIVFDV